MIFILLAAQAATAPPAEPTPHSESPQRLNPASGTAGVPAPPPQPVATAGRVAENAVTQAEDAFGFSVGRETLGLYSSSNVRGFSPFAAGNVRIEGLYFDPYLTLLTRLRQSTAIRVGLSAQGYPFPSPTGIVDYAFRKPGNSASLSTLVSADSYGNLGIEADAVLPLSTHLSLAAGAQATRNDFYNGTDSFSHNEAIALRWQPSTAVELIPFWQRSEVMGDEAGPTYIPAGPYLPPKVARRRFNGPSWADYNSVAGNAGLLAAIAPGRNWTIRGGLFRSFYDDSSSFAHLLTGVTPDGLASRTIIADPQSKFVSVSGELRVTHSLTEGPRLHVFHLSLRGRDRRQRYAGSDVIDYGLTTINTWFEPVIPTFAFGQQTRDRVRQWTGGVAYEGRWRGIGELAFGVSQTHYRKRFELPGAAPLSSRSEPWLYNVTAAASLTSRLTIYAGYVRGLEESGIAPDNAINRNQPLPAILTSQRDAGLHYVLTPDLKLVAGAFELRKPYYNLDAASRFDVLGDIVSRGVELSIAGKVSPRLNVVAGGVLVTPRVTGEGVTLGRVGRDPVGIAKRSLDFNVDWQLPWAAGFSLDVSVSHVGRITATRDNHVLIPSRTLIGLGGRYRFRVSNRSAALRIRASNVGNVSGFDLRGAGAYDIIPGRVVSCYLTVDF